VYILAPAHIYKLEWYSDKFILLSCKPRD